MKKLIVEVGKNGGEIKGDEFSVKELLRIQEYIEDEIVDKVLSSVKPDVTIGEIIDKLKD